MTAGRNIGRHGRAQGGYLLLPVVVGLALIASMALLLNHESAVNVGISGRDAEIDLLRQVAEAGWQHANWQAQGKDCTGYAAIPSTSFADHAYSANISPDAGSPVTIAATGTLVNGNTLTVSRSDVKIYDQDSETLILQPGSGGEDAYVWDGAHKDKNFGVSTKLSANNASAERTSFLRFDLSGLPSEARVVGATLELFLTGGNALSSGVLDVHTVTKPRVEGVEDDAVPTRPGVTYNDYDGTNPWDSGGGDFDATPVDSITIPSMVTGPYQWNVGDAVVAWVDGATNNGFVLRASGGTVDKVDFTSSDGATASQRPKLSIDYVCECGVVCVPAGGGLPLILSTEGAATLGGLSFTDKDLAEYDPVGDTATLYLDGVSVGVTQDIDAVHVLTNDRIVLSTINTTTLGGITFENEDLVEYDPVSDTAILRFDGSALFSDVDTDISAVHVMEDGKLLLTNEYTATLGGLSFDPNDGSCMTQWPTARLCIWTVATSV